MDGRNGAMDGAPGTHFIAGIGRFVAKKAPEARGTLRGPRGRKNNCAGGLQPPTQVHN
jgi:hypothetical protein